MRDIIQWFIHVLDFINKLAPIGLIITFIAFIKQMKDSKKAGIEREIADKKGKKADKERERTHVLERMFKINALNFIIDRHWFLFKFELFIVYNHDNL